MFYEQRNHIEGKSPPNVQWLKDFNVNIRLVTSTQKVLRHIPTNYFLVSNLQ